jgi:hypothetical protein
MENLSAHKLQCKSLQALEKLFIGKKAMINFKVQLLL